MYGFGLAGGDAADALAYPGAAMSVAAEDGAGLCHQYRFFVGVARGRLYVAVAAKAGQGLVVAVFGVESLSLRAAGGEGHRRVAAAAEEVARFKRVHVVFAKSGAGVAAIAAVAKVFEYLCQFVARDARRVVQQVELPLAVGAVPVLFAGERRELVAAGSVGGAVDAVVRLGVAGEQVGGDVVVAFGVLLPVAHGFFEPVQRQPLAFFQCFAVFFAGRFFPIGRR